METRPARGRRGRRHRRVGGAAPSRPIIVVRRRATHGRRAAARRDRRGGGARATSGSGAMGTGSPAARRGARADRARSCVGEETVLLRALEDRRAQPDQRPPYPTRARPVGPADASSTTSRRSPPCPGSWPTARAPTPRIGRPGRAGHDAASSSAARCRKPGIVEVPLGTPICEVARRARRRRRTGTLKAVLVGGPTGGFLPADALDTPLSHDGAASRRRDAGLGHARWSSTTATCLVDLADAA